MPAVNPAKELVKENKAIIFSATYCPYCRKAKDVLKSTGAKFKIVEVDVEKKGNELRKGLYSLTGRTSVPAVFVHGKFIGGCNDGPGVVPLQKKGKLVPLLKEAGAL
uniref:Glutaredoxin domain-containing protein n=1 Tax=Amorphochlora amoebiformis TaxID=1561963 RepID=A0A7S0GRY1_9EUKA|mmetsp:Transcript_13445/g.21269  ORF Transcript_13445/g.21269 Transcript_13445/m.21269 type:complete len:107 (+) Transcript_13445:95-415(+)